jgi:hypothetical protein
MQPPAHKFRVAVYPFVNESASKGAGSALLGERKERKDEAETDGCRRISGWMLNSREIRQ